MHPTRSHHEPLRIGFTSVVRPLFKGDSGGAAERSLAALRELGRERGFDVVTARVDGNDRHVSGAEFPSFAVSNAAAAAAAAAQLARAQLDFLLVQHGSFATGDLLKPLLKAVPRVGVWALPEDAGRPGRSGPLPLNSLCGLNMTLSFLGHPEILKREPVKWFYGGADDPAFRERFLVTLQALRGLRALERARVLQIGGVAPAFWGIEESPGLDGVTVDSAPLADLFESIAAVPERAAEERADELAAREPLDAPREHLRTAARMLLGLEALAAEGSYDALAVRCWPELPERCGAMACASLAALGDRDIPAACEGDVMGALSMVALQAVTGHSAILMDLSDADAADDTLLFWHCGNAPKAWASAGGTRLTTHFNRDGVGVVRDMTLRPGPATGFRLLERGRSALVFDGSFAGDAKEGYDGVRGWLGDLRWNGARVNAREFVANTLDRRLPHHFAFGTGHVTDGLVELCAHLGARPLEVLPASRALRP